MRIHTGNKPNRYNQCNYSSSGAGNLKKHHMQKHGNIKNSIKCNICNSTFSQLSGLSAHMKTHSSRKKQTEAASAILQLFKLAAWRHSMKHTANKPFNCNQCKYTSFENRHLSHIWIHTPTVNYFNCRKAFSSESTRKAHEDAQLREATQMYTVSVCILSARSFEDTHENEQWRAVS